MVGTGDLTVNATMIRFRLGQSWKHEDGAAEPSDAISLELDGVDLLAGARDEPLISVVPALVDALYAMVLGHERTGQVSLAEAELELCFLRLDDREVELTVVSLGRTPRVVRGPLTLDLLELAGAAAKCADALVRDLSQHSPQLLRTAKLVALRQHARKLLAAHSARALDVDPVQWSHLEPARPSGPGFRLEDDRARLTAWKRKGAAALPPLLFSGELQGAGETRVAGLPFLLLLDASRRASQATEDEKLALGGKLEATPAEVFSLGLKLCFALTARNPAMAVNPYLEALTERCQEGLSALRQPTPAVLPARSKARKAPPKGKRLSGPGAIRRLRFATVWEKETPSLEGEGELRLAPKGPLVVTRHAAMAFATDGRVLYRRVEAEGLNVSDDGRVLAHRGGMLMLFEAGGKEALWLRDYSGPALFGPVHRRDGTLTVSLAGRGVACFSEATGRELWRVDPSRAQSGHFALHGERGLLATDTGSLLGVDLKDGVTRFRIRTSLPFTVAPTAGGRRLVAQLSRGERTALICADLSTGALHWTRELNLERPSAPIMFRQRTLLAGRRGGKVVLVALSRTGDQLWERPLPLDGKHLFVLGLLHGAVVQDSRGAAAFVSSDGQIDWVLGTAGADLPHAVGPAHARGVVILPGEAVRAVEPRSGRVLAEMKVGPALTALAADRALNLFLLMENGLLRSLKLAAQLSVV
jgi:outer membrane protein assembly factor BamB